MIVRLRGLLQDVEEGAVVVERDGLAHEVHVPSYAVTELAACRGQTVTLHTMEYLEGNVASGNLVPRLIGFLHAADRAFFQQLITVKGLGVRKGLRALGAPAARIASCIESGDAAGLCRLPGIGRRMADQIIAELRGKVSDFAWSAESAPAAVMAEYTDEQRDAIEIIVAWGDARADAQRWVARAAQLHGDVQGADAWVKAAYRVKSGAES